MDNLITAITLVTVFLAGRYSMIVVQNKKLEERRMSFMEEAKEIIEELNCFNQALNRKKKALDQQEEDNRRQYQKAIVDISRYQFMGNKSDHWTPMDDEYLKSWSSVEKNEFDDEDE